MITIGKTYRLKAVKKLDFGVYLDAENLYEVLLPKKYVPRDLAIGDEIEVFLYLDSEDRPVATTLKPKAKLGEFAYLQVVDVNNTGAFLDWGLEKDLFVPFAEQHRTMEVGRSYIVYIFLDKLKGRITASSKIDKFLDDEKPHDFTPHQPVHLLIANSTDLGFKAIINNSHWGVLYKNEVHQRLSFGQSIDGFTKYLRPDGRIDLSLIDSSPQVSKEIRDKNEKLILDYLKQQNGFAPVHDKTDPKIISDLFGLSKKAFKKAISALYKQRIINIEKDGINIVKNK
ncbi:MAG: S1-like domain-containing RNA-binding protein [Gammaproteobacteria bacterium]|nr:S1-like domain-containing RNA-binding protein [Gammaproteobacteria bacterium]MCW8987770.1 S1-like domain-containing RNA-binding protein [Gammaproteobacteria bacterium]MCW9029892.1 S1-like domain-containing RNA-binding protein [Gammaproteobacteria bacterium]